MKVVYPQRMLKLSLGAALVFHAGKKSEGKWPFPPCSLTSWYYRYAITPHIAKLVRRIPGIWNLKRHSEHNSEPQLGTTTRNQPNLFGPLELRTILPIETNQYVKRSKIASRDACGNGFVNRLLKFI